MLPVAHVVIPGRLIGARNGELPDELLEPVPGWGTGQRLVAPAARSWRGMVAAARADGIPLTCTGTYRPLAEQVALFLARYVPASIPGRPSKTWRGTTYWLLPGKASAATPGSSNHGLGLAVDAAVELDGDPEPESIDARTLAWLRAHAPAFGWSWELQSEPWHLRYVAGDTLPPALAAAHDTPPPPAPPSAQEVAPVGRVISPSHIPDSADGRVPVVRLDPAGKQLRGENGPHLVDVDGVVRPAVSLAFVQEDLAGAELVERGRKAVVVAGAATFAFEVV